MSHARKAENKLAIYKELEKAYPREGESDLLKKWGGNLEHRENNSALRISAVLNRTGRFSLLFSLCKTRRIQIN